MSRYSIESYDCFVFCAHIQIRDHVLMSLKREAFTAAAQPDNDLITPNPNSPYKRMLAPIP